MTICIGALAAGGHSIVCVADKAITYADDIQGDTDSTKIVPVGTRGAHVLISGNETTISRMLASLNTQTDIGKSSSGSRTILENTYKEIESEMLEAAFLKPFLSITDYSSAVTKQGVNTVIEGIARRIEEARQQQAPVNCGLLLCGFDENDSAFILDLAAPGLSTNMTHTGFHAIGSGSGYALNKLLSCDWERTHSVDQVLYECFDAKATAEQDPNVGYDWDAVILTKGQVEHVPKPIKTMIDRAWTQHTRSPYENWNEEDDLPLPPENWKQLLREYAEGVMLPASQRSQDQREL
jgi:hypothetical protein